VADTRTDTGVTSFFADLQVVKRNLRPCSLFTPDSGHDLFRYSTQPRYKWPRSFASSLAVPEAATSLDWLTINGSVDGYVSRPRCPSRF
jgi:hypothetical protein